jgi:predicted HAD superfamily phosphohydrolase
MNEQIEGQTITIDGHIHELSTLSEEQLQIVHHCQRADAEMTRLQDLMAIISTGRQQYINELGKQLNEEQEETEGNSLDTTQ